MITCKSTSLLYHPVECWVCLVASGRMLSALTRSSPSGNALLPHVEPGTCTVAPSHQPWLRESHGAGSPAVMSVHLGKCLLFLSAVQEVYVLLNKVHVPYANERPLEW